MRSLRLFALCAPFLSCVGPPAPDAALCQDVIHRLCLGPRCAEVDAALAVGDSCEQTLLSRTGCAAEDFAFASPSRAQVLECRLPLLRSGIGADQHPSCDDVAETVETCGDLIRFLGGPGR